MFNNLTLTKLYIIPALIFGLTMVVIVPPFQIPDENRHYMMAASISEGRYTCEDGKTIVSKEKLNLIEAMDLKRIAAHPEEKFRLSSLFNYVDYGDGYDGISNILCYSWSISHLHSALIIAISKSLGLSSLIGFYLGRLINLLIGIMIFATAIKTTPVGKPLLIGIGLLPMMIHQLASLSYDAVVIPSTILFISTILNIYYSKAVSLKKIIALSMLSFTLIWIRFVYTPFLLLLLGLKRRQFSSFKNILLLCAGILTAFISLYIQLKSTSSYDVIDAIKPQFWQQAKFSLSNPLIVTSGILLSSISNIPNILLMMSGILGWLDYTLHNLTYILIFVFFIICIGMERQKLSMTKNKKTLLITSSTIVFFSTFFAVYLMETPLGQIKITSVHGRYFLPIIFPLVLGVKGYGGQIYRNKLLLTSLLIVFSLIFAGTTYSVLLRYYM